MPFSYPENLPIFLEKENIAEAIAKHQVVVIAGETGSGKTTQIPKICLELFAEKTGKIGCTQPRRIAAMTVSARVAEELAQDGNTVGYKIRFKDATTDETRIKFMTDGVLLAEIRNDPMLRQYDVLIIDEAHERSLNIDFILGHLKNLLQKRGDLKLIITSATIDTEAFSNHFGKAPVLSIPGKAYPVETRYRAPQLDDRGEEENYIDAAQNCAVEIVTKEGPGDILIFLPTEKDILNCVKALQKRLSNCDVLPLFGRLTAGEQKRIFQPSKKQKVIAATNVAETSITVPNIRYVIDTGLARIASYNPRARTNSLPIVKISQSSCDQRKGRCGRVGPGICYRLYDEENFDQRAPYTTPEIKRSNLAEVILHMVTFGLGDPATFPFIDAPAPSAINDGYRLLRELGAIGENRKLTKTGRMMASMPIDPCISRIIIEASSNNCLREVMIIATVLAIQDPRIRPQGQENKADEAHAAFAHERSDFLTYLNIWELFHSVKEKTSWSRLKKFCQAHYLSFQRMREWIDLHDQMHNIVKRSGNFVINAQDAAYDSIHKSLAIGFIRNVAQKKEKKLYLGTSNKELLIFPGSDQSASKSQWIMAASFLETSRLYALTVAAIEPEWLEPIAPHLCSYSWSAPRYQKKTGMIVATEKVSLFGLVLVAGREVNFAKTSRKNQQEAREIFIQDALVPGQLNGTFPFLQKNLQLVRKWEDLESRLRKKNLLSPEIAIQQFYDDKLPYWVCDKASLIKFLRRQKDTDELLLTEEIILQRRPEDRELSDFPPKLTVGSHTFKLSYTFDPANDEDGVTITLPYDLAATLPQAPFEWLVPGLLQEKITYLLKSLPKGIRRHLVPVSNTVDRVLDDCVHYEGSLFKAIERSVFKQYKLTIHPNEWPDVIPNHLLMRFAIVDISGKVLGSGRDLPTLLESCCPGKDARKAATAAADKGLTAQWEGKKFAVWEFPALPKQVPIRTKSGDIAGYLYPVIELQDGSQTELKIHFAPDEEACFTASRTALTWYLQKLFQPQFKALKNYCATRLSGPSTLWLLKLYPARAEAVQDILHFLTIQLFDIETITAIPEIVRKERYNFDVYKEGARIIDTILALLRQRREIAEEVERFRTGSKRINAFPEALYADFSARLDEILPRDFLKRSFAFSLDDRERYLRGLLKRIDRATADFSKDMGKGAALKKFETFLQQTEEKDGNHPLVCSFRHMLQEFRLATYAPEVKTRYSVSEKKLKKLADEIRMTV